MSASDEACDLRVAGQEIDTSRGRGRLDLPVRAAPGLPAVLAARIVSVSARLWRVGPEWSIEPRHLDDDFFYLPLAGNLLLDVGGRTHRLAPGGIALVPVGEVHSARYAPGSRSLVVVAIHAHLRDAGGAPLLTGATPTVLPLPDHRGWAGRLLLGEVAATPDLLGASLRLLLAELILDGLTLRQPAERGDTRLAAAFGALHDHPEAAHSIPALARACGLGPVRFRQLFRLAAGVPPKAYLDRLRLARARALLSASAAPVASVAAASGFANTRHFLARFRAATGRTPTAWRRGGGDGP